MNDNITLEQAIQQNCINLLSHKDFGYKFIPKEDNLIFRKVYPVVPPKVEYK